VFKSKAINVGASSSPAQKKARPSYSDTASIVEVRARRPPINAPAIKADTLRKGMMARPYWRRGDARPKGSRRWRLSPSMHLRIPNFLGRGAPGRQDRGAAGSHGTEADAIINENLRRARPRWWKGDRGDEE